VSDAALLFVQPTPTFWQHQSIIDEDQDRYHGVVAFFDALQPRPTFSQHQSALATGQA
jgi:hypothetical protein